MMRSLYSGVAGLQNHQIRMDVLGNNIANVNTNGFKKGRVNFQDLLYQQMSGAARPTEQVGGINPKEIGLGMSVASVDTIHTQGSLQTTGIMTDLAIQGNGFFVMERGDSRFFPRAGAFSLDAEGRLVNPGNGFRVQGWNAQILDGIEVLNTSGELQDLVIPIGAKDPARATEQVYLACNLDKRLIEIPEGANEAVINMLHEIGSKQNIPTFLSRVKDKNDHTRLMGFGHRVYKNYDPRAKVMRQTCHEVLTPLGIQHDPLLELAMEMEQIALKDEYFVSKKLYPNVDFYSGIIFRAIGIPTSMFTVLFAVARTVGWISQWSEMIEDPQQKIGRPRQLYTGAARRDYVEIGKRG